MLPTDSLIKQRRWVLRLPAFCVAGLVLLPVLVILLSWTSDQTSIWQHLIETQLSRLLGNTLILVVGVGISVMFIGVGLAWLTSMCEFPGRKWLDWALMLPLAIPTYVVAFVFLGVFNYSGPVQTWLRRAFGMDVWFPDIRSPGGVVLVMTAVLYPYVYMLARGAFLAQGRELMDSARLLNHSPWQAFVRVALPIARPAIVAGTSLALMETLADFGAVSVFNFDTFTTAIYKSWFGFYSLPAAAQLASLLLLFVSLLLILEQRSRGRGRVHQKQRQRGAYQLVGWRAYLATSLCLMVVGLAFVLPVGQLLSWVLEINRSDFNHRYWELVVHTFALGLMAAAIAAGLAVLVALSQRMLGRQQIGSVVRFASLGYALPGSVLAVGIMLAFAAIDSNIINPVQEWLGVPVGQVLLGSLLALILAYVVRFFSVAYGPVQSGLERIRPSFQEAAQTLGATRAQVLWRIYIPLLAPSILSAVLLVLVDVMKEMPATLLMRPFGWDTLAVRVYEMTSEGEWQRAALPALTLVLVSIPPVIILIRRTQLTR